MYIQYIFYYQVQEEEQAQEKGKGVNEEGKEERELVRNPEKWRGVLFFRFFLLVSDFWSWADGNDCLG